MNDSDRPEHVAEILIQFILLERSKDWLNNQIEAKIQEIDIAEQSESSNSEVLRSQLKSLYHRCSFEKRQMDRFMEKYGHAIPTGQC